MRKFKIGNVVLYNGTYWIVSKTGTAQITAVHLASDTRKVISALDSMPPMYVADTVKEFMHETVNEKFD